MTESAEVLWGSPYARETSLNDLWVRADRRSVPLAGDPDVVEFAQRVNRAAQLCGW